MATFGFHYFPDDTHYRAGDLQAWLPELQALGARWLTLLGSLTRNVPEPFISGLKAAGLEPIIHIPATPIRAADVEALAPLFNAYARWGVRYVVVFTEPNTRAAWSQMEWARAGLVERFLETMIPIWQAQLSAGLEPVFPALKAGGDYWDTAFLEAALAGLQRAQPELLKRLTFAVNLWTFGRPLEWGAGGLKAWPMARPYATPPGTQDQRGFHLFDWYNEIIEARVGERRPLLCLAGGPRLGEAVPTGDEQPPSLDDLRHASCIQAIITLMNENRLPANLLNVNFWLLAAPASSPFAGEAWYRNDGATLSAVETLKQSAIRRAAPLRRGEADSKTRPISHYLLLPTFEWGISEWHWHAALEFVKAQRPVCGFSVDEALLARRVTIFGNEQGVSAEAEAKLKQAGCEVERIVNREAGSATGD